MANANVVPDKAPKAKLVTNYYENQSGETSSRPWEDTVAVGKIFDNGFNYRMVLEEIPGPQRIQLAAFGLQQVTQNAYGTAENTEERIEACRARHETIRDGSWASERQSGPATGDLVAAYVEAKQEKTGRAVTADDAAEFKRKIEAGELTHKGILENALINAKYQAIRARKMSEIAAQAAEKAAAAGSANDSLLG